MTQLILPPSATETRINAERAARGFTEPADARKILIHLAVAAGYDFKQITAQLRSGKGDERADFFGRAVTPLYARNLRGAPGDDRAPCEPGGETLHDRAMRDA